MPLLQRSSVGSISTAQAPEAPEAPLFSQMIFHRDNIRDHPCRPVVIQTVSLRGQCSHTAPPHGSKCRQSPSHRALCESPFTQGSSWGAAPRTASGALPRGRGRDTRGLSTYSRTPFGAAPTQHLRVPTGLSEARRPVP